MENEKKNLEEKDQTSLWHPFTQMKEWIREDPLIIREGKGNNLIDLDGNRYLDGVSSLWVNLHGHRKRAIDRAIRDQLRRIAHSTLLGLSNVPSIQLADRLIRWAHRGGLDRLTRVFYSDNGSTAVEIALKMAFQYWQQRGGEYNRKIRFITLHQAYHGDTLGAVSLGGIDLFHQIYKPLLFQSLKAPSPDCYRCPMGKRFPDCALACVDPMEALLRERAHETAAVILEPAMQAAAGMIALPPGYLRKVRDLCTRYGVLLIADEVAVGFGRTGRMFACEYEGVIPDFLTLAKGITGGYLPLAVTLTTEEIFNGFLGEFRDRKTFFHGHSYTGNPLGCAAALANLDIFEQEKVLGKLPGKIACLKEEMQSLWKFPAVGDIRQRGLMAGVELVIDRSVKTPYPWEDRIGFQVCLETRKMGLLLRPLGNVIVLLPPLSITKKEIRWMVKTVAKAISTVTGRTRPSSSGSSSG